MPFALKPLARASGAGFTPPVLVGGGGSDVDDEAQPAFAVASADGAAGFVNVFDGGGDDDGPPIEALEAQMRSEMAARGDSRASAASGGGGVRRRAADEDDDDAPAGGKGAPPLPELDELVARLPAEVRDVLDELFRARFVSVKKLPKKVFQAASAKAPPASA